MLKRKNNAHPPLSPEIAAGVAVRAVAETECAGGGAGAPIDQMENASNSVIPDRETIKKSIDFAIERVRQEMSSPRPIRPISQAELRIWERYWQAVDKRRA